jgi:ATP-dependent DNA helicase RecQ
MATASSANKLEQLRQVIQRHWGFRTFRPLQEQAMGAVLAGRDSLVVMPTGGGKSLCYQAPAVVQGGTTVVISPLISLMKDQVDSLRACGVPAIQIDSSLSAMERNAYEQDILQGAVRLLFVSPERLVLTDFCSLLRRIDVRTFAIDEAHCISHWGHDFRPEYRQLRRIKEWFPKASVHGYTATATERVRNDIVVQLALTKPEILVGNFDRPNLNYRVLPRLNLERQVMEVLERHQNEAGIIYCLRRRDVDDLNAMLQSSGIPSLPYHAGMEAEDRKSTQDAFSQEKCNLIVATVAFGMGIDRSNIRFILHTAMPKSVEHYQQETGRAGRDGLEAECVLLHSGGDAISWRKILEKSALENEVDASFLPNALKHVNDMDRYCRSGVCRHRALVEYFGQRYESQNCMACDMCLGDNEPVPEPVVLAQKILSCVARTQERFGINHVAAILRGENTERIRSLGHDKLSTFGLLREVSKAALRDWIFQLIGQGVLDQTGDEYPILRLNDASWEVMHKQRSVRLLQPVKRAREERAAKSKADTTSWESVDRELFEGLRELRLSLAGQRQVPPYIIFSDATLRELARIRPTTLENMKLVYGIGNNKLQDYGNQFLQIVLQHCRDRALSGDVTLPPPKIEDVPKKTKIEPGSPRARAIDLFREGCVVEDVMHQVGKSRARVVDYLKDHIEIDRPESIIGWVSEEVYKKVAAAAEKVGTARLKPVYLALEEEVPYDEIRLVVAHLATRKV